MIHWLTEKQVKVKWSPFKISILFTLLLSLYFIISHRLLRPYLSKPGLFVPVHIIQDALSILIGAFIIYIIIKQDRKKLLASKQKLQEEQKTLYTLINNVPDFVYLKDKEGHWIEANEASRRFFEIEDVPYEGKTSAHIIKIYGDRQRFFSICHDSDIEAWRSKKTIRFEQIFQKKDGTLLTYDVIKVPIFDTNGEPKVLVVTARDITNSKITENKLKESEQRYESLYNAISGGIVLKDREGTVLHANEEACKILGVKQEEIHGGNPKNAPWKFFEDDGRLLSYEEQPYMIALRTGQRIQNAVLGVELAGDSSYRWILANYEPILDTATGQPIEVLGTFLDITDLKQTQERLRESEERYRLLVEHLPDKIVVVNQKGIFSFINKEGAAIMGVKEPWELLGKNVFDFIEPDYHELIKISVTKTKREKVIIGPLEYKINTFDNRIIEVETIFISINYEGQPAWLGVGRDITGRKQIEEALRKADTISIAGNLAAGVAHEVRNPLTVIRGFIQLFKQQYGSENQYFEIVLAEVNRIELIIDEFLMLSKPQSFTFRKNSIQKIIQGTVTLFETQAIMKNIEIITVYDENLPMIECEENQLKQVFINLLKNAMESMADAGVIKVEAKKQEEGISVRFVDQGCGIPPEKIKKLGEPFYTTKEKGTGLGLMVSYNIIKNHKGKINVVSLPGQGTSFEIILPLTLDSASKREAE
jgi:two-component system, sporulation sensor kinase A